MAFDASDAVIHMGRVIEVNVLREVMDLDPLHWLTGVQLSRMGWRTGLCPEDPVWQFMQVCVGGSEAKGVFSTVL